MADQQSVHSANEQLDAVIPATGRLTLHTNRPPTSGNEVNGNAYARQTILAARWTRETVNGFRRIKNTDSKAFPNPAGGGWATGGGCLALWDGVPGGATDWLWYVDIADDIAEGAAVSVEAGVFGYGVALEE